MSRRTDAAEIEALGDVVDERCLRVEDAEYVAEVLDPAADGGDDAA
jgi:hypothetical protein